MINTLEILILGDSFATSLGCFERNFLDVFQRKGFHRPVRITNPSTFNMTSADALVLLRDYAQRGLRFGAVVLALGNCDSCGFGYSKKVYPFAQKWLARRYDRAVKKRMPLLRRHPPFTFRAIDPTRIEGRGAVQPKDFQANLAAAAKLARSMGAKVIVLSLNANRLFPPCNNTGNYSFYKVFGLESRIPYSGLGECGELNAALFQHDHGDRALAESLYLELEAARAKDEVADICRNNRAALAFAAGQHEKALALLAPLANGRSPVRPILLFNMALAMQALGNQEQSRALFAEAFETDFGSYRTRSAYREGARRASEGALLLDCDEMARPEDYVDYCHPSQAAHERLALALEDALELQPGRHAPQLAYDPVNPDQCLGFADDFFWYFQINVLPHAGAASALAGEADGEYARLLKAMDTPVGDPGLAFRNAILAHPLFGSDSFLRQRHPRLKCDQGRVPEFFFLRHMLPAYRLCETRPELLDGLGPLAQYVPSARKMSQWWDALRLPALAGQDVLAREAGALVDWDTVAERLEKLLRHHVSAGAVYPTRVRSISTWFMRESLIFSPVSHMDMLFRRMDLWKVADTALFCRAYGPASGPARARIEHAARRGGELVTLHRSHVAGLAPARPDPAAMDRYARDLAAFGAALEQDLP